MRVGKRISPFGCSFLSRAHRLPLPPWTSLLPHPLHEATLPLCSIAPIHLPVRRKSHQNKKSQRTAPSSLPWDFLKQLLRTRSPSRTSCRDRLWAADAMIMVTSSQQPLSRGEPSQAHLYVNWVSCQSGESNLPTLSANSKMD